MERTHVMNVRISVLALLAAVTGATAALASIPDDLEGRTRSGILHVCRDREPGQPDYVQCDAHEVEVDPTTPYTGAECAAAGLPAECTIDFLPKVKVTGTMLLVNDDVARDEAADFITATAIVLDLKAKGQRARILDVFDGAEIGHWNEFDEIFLVDSQQNITFSDAEKTAFNFASDNLSPVGEAVRALAQAAYPTVDFTNTVAMLTSVKRAKPKKNVDHSSGTDPLASAAQFKVVIQFARVLP
jgi:23S rRNA U2552 (ribose-2'-O)-methylase RlmE/FtsJ